MQWCLRQLNVVSLLSTVQVGQKGAALQTLHDTITNKRQQRNWTKALEQVRGVGLQRWVPLTCSRSSPLEAVKCAQQAAVAAQSPCFT